MSTRRHRTGKSAAILLAFAVAAAAGGAWAQPGQPPAPVPIPTPAPASAGELALSGPAFTLADEAFRAMERRDYRTAVTKAEEAIRQRPYVPRLKRLVVASLEASGNPLEAERRAAEFVAAGDSDPGLLADRDRLRRNLRGSALARAQMDVLKDPNDPAARRRLAQILAAASPPGAPDPAYVAAQAA